MREPLSPLGKAGARVLVVEDEYLIAAMVSDMLADLGCVCVGPIGTHDEGLKAALTEPCDAAIINLVIQGRYAYEIAEALARREIPFCFASGMPPSEINEPWRTRPFMLKPYTAQHIHKFLLEVLAAKS